MNSSELASSLKKHKSLEDIQRNGIREEDEDASCQPAVTCEKKKKKCCKGKSTRACGVNESFRAAIDHSYDAAVSRKPPDLRGMTAFVISISASYDSNYLNLCCVHVKRFLLSRKD